MDKCLTRLTHPHPVRLSLQLEKFKFVLDFKIKELKRQIEPRETEIGSMKEQIKEMDRELEQVTFDTRLIVLKVLKKTPGAPSSLRTCRVTRGSPT